MNNRLIEEFLSLGCQSKKEAALALQVYLDLLEVKRYWEVNFAYNAELGNLYFTARKSKSSEEIIFVPIPASDKLSFNGMEKYMGISNEKNSVCLAISTADSTCVYYQLTSGISDPPVENPPVSRDTKRDKLNHDLHVHRDLLKEAAMHGITIKNIPKPP